MGYLISQLWLFLLIALIAGCLVGWLACNRSADTAN